MGYMQWWYIQYYQSLEVSSSPCEQNHPIVLPEHGMAKLRQPDIVNNTHYYLDSPCNYHSII